MRESEQTDEQLQSRLELLADNFENIPYTEERREQVKREMSHIAFEQLYRRGELWRIGVKK